MIRVPRILGRRLLVWGGVVGVAAAPLVNRLRARVGRGEGFADNPVGPFRQAPCYRADAAPEAPPEERHARTV